MSFAAPAAWLLAAVAIPIITLYILKVRLRRVPVSTNLFWRQIYDEKPPRSIWQYLRHLLSLLAQLLLLALMVAAVADPYFPWQLLQSRRIVMVVDSSASMRAEDAGGSRFDAAIDAAAAMVEGLRFRDEMAIVQAGVRPTVVLGMSSHVPTLKRALRQMNATDNPTQLNDAIELGRQLAGDHPRATVVVFTDGCAADPFDSADADRLAAGGRSDDLPANQGASPAIEFRLFGEVATANVGITQFQVRRSLIDPLGYEVLAAVRNASDQPLKCRLELELDGATVDILPLDLAPEQTWSRSLEKTSLEGGRLTARITQVAAAAVAVEDNGADNANSSSEAVEFGQSQYNALATDDVAWAILPARQVQRVLLITPGNLFLRKVFEANPLVQVAVLAQPPEQWPADTLVVLHRELPEQLPAGNVLVVDPAASCDQWQLGELLENPIITEQDRDSPLMTHVRLDNVWMPKARQLQFVRPPRVLAGAVTGEPVYAELPRESGKCLVLTVDLDRSDLAFRTAFPILVANALGWFAGASGELRESSASGSVIRFSPSDGAGAVEQRWTLRSPAGREFPLTPRAAVDNDPRAEPLSVGPLDECGVWTLQQQTSDQTADQSASPDGKTAGEPQAAPVQAPQGDLPAVVELAVNLANSRETDLRPNPAIADRASKAPAAAHWLARPVWFYLITVVCVLAVMEWLLYQRRVIS